MSGFAGLFFDLITAVALGVTIFYCLRLSRQFAEMKADRKAFETLIQSLNVAAAKAEGAVRAFREVALTNGDMLQDKISRSKALSEELEIMIQAGDNLANRLQTLAEKSRKAAAALDGGPSSEEAPKTGELQPRTRAEKELVEAIKSKQTS